MINEEISLETTTQQPRMKGEVCNDPRIWGPHYWFFLQTVARTYPHHPSSVTKKIYYSFFQTQMPLFLPVEAHAVEYEKLLNEYPVTPYLDNRDSLMTWVHFIHNRINYRLSKPDLSFREANERYEALFVDTEARAREWRKTWKRLVALLFLSAIGFIIYYDKKLLL
jgi:Erv1 / Alr family